MVLSNLHKKKLNLATNEILLLKKKFIAVNLIQIKFVQYKYIYPYLK